MKAFLLYITIGFTLLKLDVASVRIAYRDAVSSKTKAFLLYDELTPITKKDNASLVAYKGAVTVLTSKYIKGAKDKKERLVKGVSLIEYALDKEPNTIEIRFIRMTLQQNIPKFLKYNTAIETDKAFILSNFQKTKSKVLKQHIKDYILQSKFFTTAEKNVISQP